MNSGAIGIALEVLLKRRPRELGIPHRVARSVSSECVPYDKLAAAGAKVVLFDKDNTLTIPFETTFHPDAIDGVRCCVFLLSCSLGHTHC